MIVYNYKCYVTVELVGKVRANNEQEAIERVIAGDFLTEKCQKDVADVREVQVEPDQDGP